MGCEAACSLVDGHVRHEVVLLLHSILRPFFTLLKNSLPRSGHLDLKNSHSVEKTEEEMGSCFTFFETLPRTLKINLRALLYCNLALLSRLWLSICLRTMQSRL